MERKTNHGIPCSPESLAEWERAFTDIEESVEYCESTLANSTMVRYN